MVGGNLKIWDSSRTSLWSALQFPSNSSYTTMELMDSGNLVLKELGVNGTTLWQSFQNPTDTFLPGMNMTGDLKLTSWKASDDPSPGSFRFLKDTGGRFIIEKHGSQYWVSKELWQNFSTETDGMIVDVIEFLSLNTVGGWKDTDYTRAVMDFSGNVQYLARNRTTGEWDVIWSEPRNKCNVVSACGTFASCRSDTKHTCRCLPGFEPASKDEWGSGDYSHGCKRKSEICIKEVVEAREFFKLNMKMKRTSNIVKVNGDGECKSKCLESCTCKAYAEIGISRTNILCAIWEDDLQSIWEYADDGGDVYVRIKRSDIEYITALDCETCGSSIVPYPLSTGPNCGDPMYGRFDCLLTYSMFYFQAEDDSYEVTNIDPQSNIFTIATNGSICRGNDKHAIQKLLKLENSSTFNVKSGCDSEFHEIDIQWEKPLEPICNAQKDCTNWQNSLCNSSTDAKTGACAILLLTGLVPAAVIFQKMV